MATEATNPMPPRKSPRVAHPITGLALLLLGLSWAAYLVHRILTDKGSYHFSTYEEHTIRDNIRRAAPFLTMALAYVLVGVGVVCRWRWAGTPARVLLALALLVLGGYTLFFLILFLLVKLTGSSPFPV